MIIKNEVMLSGNYSLSYCYGLEQKEGDAKTTTVYIVGNPSAKTVYLQAVQYPDEGDELNYYTPLCDLEKFTNCNTEKLANFIFYYCPLWFGEKRQINDLDAEKIKYGIFEVLQAIEKLTK